MSIRWPVRAAAVAGVVVVIALSVPAATAVAASLVSVSDSTPTLTPARGGTYTVRETVTNPGLTDLTLTVTPSTPSDTCVPAFGGTAVNSKMPRGSPPATTPSVPIAHGKAVTVIVVVPVGCTLTNSTSIGLDLTASPPGTTRTTPTPDHVVADLAPTMVNWHPFRQFAVAAIQAAVVVLAGYFAWVVGSVREGNGAQTAVADGDAKPGDDEPGEGKLLPTWLRVWPRLKTGFSSPVPTPGAGWSFTDSWATTLTGFAALLTTFVAGATDTLTTIAAPATPTSFIAVVVVGAAISTALVATAPLLLFIFSRDGKTRAVWILLGSWVTAAGAAAQLLILARALPQLTSTGTRFFELPLLIWIGDAIVALYLAVAVNDLLTADAAPAGADPASPSATAPPASAPQLGALNAASVHALLFDPGSPLRLTVAAAPEVPGVPAVDPLSAPPGLRPGTYIRAEDVHSVLTAAFTSTGEPVRRHRRKSLVL